MNVQAYKHLQDGELHKFDDRPIELELFAARMYTKIVEAAYELEHPRPEPVAVPRGYRRSRADRKSLVKRASRQDRSSEFTMTCKICGETKPRRSNGQTMCNKEQNPLCKKYTTARYMHGRNHPGEAYVSYEDYVKKNGHRE
jgi:hypothetical protein